MRVSNGRLLKLNVHNTVHLNIPTARVKNKMNQIKRNHVQHLRRVKCGRYRFQHNTVVAVSPILSSVTTPTIQ